MADDELRDDALHEGSPRDEVLENLELPDLTPGAMLRHFGPGMILMMTGIGTSSSLRHP